MRRLIAAVFLAAMATPALSADLFAQQRKAWNQPVPPYRIIDNVYFVGVEGLGAYLITTPKGHILLDGLLPESAPQIEASIAKLGFKSGDVKILLNSHAHFDHAGGLAALKKHTSARLIASAQDKPALERGVHDSDYNYGEAAYPPVKVDETVGDGGVVSLGGAVMTAHLTPGHTKGCTTWTLPVVENGVQHTVVFNCSLTVAGAKLVGNRRYPAIAGDFKATFAKLAGLKADVFLSNHPDGADMAAKHARQGQGGLNPFIDAGAYPAFVAKSKAAFEAELFKAQKP